LPATRLERIFHTSVVLKSEYVELFKDGLSEGEGVGVAKFFSRKIFVTRASTVLN